MRHVHNNKSNPPRFARHIERWFGVEINLPRIAKSNHQVMAFKNFFAMCQGHATGCRLRRGLLEAELHLRGWWWWLSWCVVLTPPPPTGPEFMLPNKNVARAGPAPQALQKKFPQLFRQSLGQRGGGAGLGTRPPAPTVAELLREALAGGCGRGFRRLLEVREGCHQDFVGLPRGAYA